MERPVSIMLEVSRLKPLPARVTVLAAARRGATAAERTAAPLKEDFLATTALVEQRTGGLGQLGVGGRGGRPQERAMEAGHVFYRFPAGMTFQSGKTAINCC